MLLVRNIRLPLTCPDPDAEAAAKALAILRVPARRAAHCGVAKLSVDARHGTPGACLHHRSHTQGRG